MLTDHMRIELNQTMLLQITFEDDRTVVAFYKFLKKHASIPFKLQKPASSERSAPSETAATVEDSSSDVKDEL